MIRKSRILALSVATAGVIGFGAPMASAATTSGLGDNGGLSQDQVLPMQSSNDPSSAFGGDQSGAFGGDPSSALGGDPTAAFDPSSGYTASDPSYGQDNGSWGGSWGNKHQKQEKQIQGIQICNNKIIVINVSENKKHDDSSDPGWSSDPSRESGKNITFKNSCEQDNDWQR